MKTRDETTVVMFRDEHYMVSDYRLLAGPIHIDELVIWVSIVGNIPVVADRRHIIPPGPRRDRLVRDIAHARTDAEKRAIIERALIVCRTIKTLQQENI